MIPIHTTLVTVLRVDDSGDPYDDEAPEPAPVASDVRAVIVEASANDAGPGDNQLTQLKMRCDPCDIAHEDQVLDQTTGKRYDVVAVHEYRETLGMDHMRVQLKRLDM